MKDEKQIQTEYGDCFIRSSSEGVELLAHAEYGDTVARLGDSGAEQLRDWLNAKYPVEAQGAQAGDECVAKAIYDADRSLFMTKREYSELHETTKARLRKMARAALATQSAVPVYIPEANVWDAPGDMRIDSDPEVAWADGFNACRAQIMGIKPAVRGAEQ